RVPIEVVEAPHLVGAVVRAITRTDAAVVRHVVEPLGRVRRRVDRTDVFAGRLLTMLAGDGLNCDARLGIVIANKIAIDADPAHLTTHLHCALTDRGDVVLGLTGDGAGVASDARAEIDDLTPAVANGRKILLCRIAALVAIVDLLPERRRVDEINRAQRGLLEPLLILIERAIYGVGLTFHPIVRLSLPDGVDAGELLDLDAIDEIESVARADLLGIEAEAATEAARGLTTPSEVERDAVIRVAGKDPDGCVNALSTHRETDHLAALKAKVDAGLIRDERRVIPDDLRHGIGRLESPEIVRVPSLPEFGIGAEGDLDVLEIDDRIGGCGADRARDLLMGDGGSRKGARLQAFLETPVEHAAGAPLGTNGR